MSFPAGGLVDGTPAGRLAIGSQGTAGHFITYIAQDKWQAKIVGHGTGDGSVVVGMQGGYNILENFDITGTDATGVMLATEGTTASYNQAIGNYVHDIIAPCNADGGGGLNSGAGNDYVGITNENIIGNLVVNITNTSGSSCPYNTTFGIYEVVPYGIVANNIVINAGYAIQSWHAAAHLTIFGNTELNSRIGVEVGAGDDGINDYTLVQNNIAVNNSVTGIHEEDNTGTHNQYIDNLGYENATDLVLQNGLTCSGCIDADPLFVSNTGTSTGNYCLQSNSSAGTGLARAGIFTDFYGQYRPQSGATVKGACIGSGSTSSTVAAGIRASATTVASGHAVTLIWTTNKALTANLNGTTVPLVGSRVVYPTTTTAYRVTAYGASGASDEGAVTVAVVAAGISASSTSVASGQAVTLTWTTHGAVSADLNGTSVPLTGSLVVNPTATTAYRITAHSSSGVTDEGTVNVTVN